jgi:hypothetical protein
VRFVAFATEEQPFNRTPEMGSFAYARRRRARREDHHRPSNLLERVDFSTLAAVTTGLAFVVWELATRRAA